MQLSSVHHNLKNVFNSAKILENRRDNLINQIDKIEECKKEIFYLLSICVPSMNLAYAGIYFFLIEPITVAYIALSLVILILTILSITVVFLTLIIGSFLSNRVFKKCSEIPPFQVISNKNDKYNLEDIYKTVKRLCNDEYSSEKNKENDLKTFNRFRDYIFRNPKDFYDKYLEKPNVKNPNKNDKSTFDNLLDSLEENSITKGSSIHDDLIIINQLISSIIRIALYKTNTSDPLYKKYENFLCNTNDSILEKLKNSTKNEKASFLVIFHTFRLYSQNRDSRIRELETYIRKNCPMS
jgi:hypothetical protein